MTVENKFKRNVLAASILVGLSLSAASGVAWAEGDSSSETSQLNGKEALPSDTNTAEKSSSEALSTEGDETTENPSSGGELSDEAPSGGSQEHTGPSSEETAITTEIKSDEKKEGDTSVPALPEGGTEKTDLSEQQDDPAVQSGNSGSLDEGKGDEDKSFIEKVGDGLNNLVNAAADLITGGGGATPEDNKEGDGQALSDGAEDTSAPVSPSTEGGDSNVQSPGGSEAVHANGDGIESDKQSVEPEGKPAGDNEADKKPESGGQPEGGKDSDAQTLPGGGEENDQPPTSVNPSDEGGDSNIQSPGGSETDHANGGSTEPDKQSAEPEGKPTGDNAPAPEAGDNAPAPEAGDNVPAPEAGGDAPAPEAGDNVPAPEAGGNVPAPEAGDNVPAPEAGGNVPAPEAGGNAPAPEAGDNAPAPEAGDNVPAPEAGGDAPAPEAGDNVPAPEAGGDAPAPEAGDNAPAPEAGGNVPAPEAGGNAPAPEAGGDAPAPEAGDNVPAPEAGGDAPAPEAGDNAPAPEAGGNVPAPEAGGNAPAPEAGGDAPAPEAGGNAPAPEAKPGPVIVTAKDVISSAGKPLTLPLIADISTSNGVLTIGESAAQGKKATPFDIWKAGGNAVELTGSLSTAAPGGTGKDDKIVVQNANIHNNLTDKVNTLVQDMKMVGLSIKATTVNSDGFVAKSAPNQENILLDNVNIALSNNTEFGSSTAIALDGSANHVLAKGGVIDAGEGYSASVLDISGSNNVVDFVGSTLKGDIKSEWSPSGALDNTVNLKGSKLTGNAVSATGNLNLVLDGSTWTGGAGLHSPDVSLRNGSVWNVAGVRGLWSGYSSVNSLNLYGSNTVNLVSSVGQAQLGGHGFTGENTGKTLHVDTDLKSDGKGVTTVNVGTYSPGTVHRLNNTGLGDDYAFGRIEADGLALGGKYRLNVESSGAEPYTIGGRLADGSDAVKAHEFVSYKTSENRPVTDKDGKTVVQIVKSDADFTSLSAPAELGVYQYAAEKVMDGVNNRTNIYYSSTGKLSNSAATVVSLAAAPVDVANLESDTLAKHMNSVRHGKDSGVWVSYFGGENRNSTAAGPEYTLKTNGVMLGVDTLTENDWLAGVAVSSARSDMSVMNSSGDLNSYGAQFYMSRRYDSGVFVDSALQFNHFSNTAKARMTDGQQAKADFSGNSYGLEAKVGYAWNSEGFFAEPYVRAAARAFDGEHYALSNGMTVNSNDYKSMLGEIGADLGYQYDISGGYVKPYLHLAALNEFADGNSVRVNNVSLDNSVKGSAFQAGLGAEVKVTDNLGGYAAFDYTKGENTERPWQATVGVNYTW